MDKPNIVLITTDQQRFDTIAALGNDTIFTPHLDWLTQQGVAFTRAYSDCPLCAPARQTIMTGQHASTHGMLDNWGVTPNGCPTLPGILTAAGYQTRAIGKMHFNPPRGHHGFEHMEITQDYFRYMARHFPHQRPIDHGIGGNEMAPALDTVPVSQTHTHWVVDRAMNFLETRDNTRPFLLNIGFFDPHPPFDPHKDFWDLYDGIEMPEPVYGDWSQSLEDVPQGYMEPTYWLNSVHRFSRKQLAASCRAYYASITQIDYKLGLLFGRLAELGLMENTWIIFVSDHGEMMGDHHMGAKVVFFEGSAHIPLLIRPPADTAEQYLKLRGSQCAGLANLADIMPTCLSLAGAAPPGNVKLDGLNLLDMAEGKVSRPHLVGVGKFHMVHDGRYKYNFAGAGGSELLFDLENDPLEQKNLAREPGEEDTLNRLRRILYTQLEQQGHPAARDGQLICVEEPRSEAEVRAHGAYPAFETPAALLSIDPMPLTGA
ncbi:MAG: sulfatase-like hydrolase/transferase [Lentisphaeria bacterium]|nr:sulfatase-like hydrolase/transferase [Lentisphaeria bacterium]MDP7741692.1 sulfatase-like hydrolase/transferase [Lentisphaeria bacterium]